MTRLSPAELRVLAERVRQIAGPEPIPSHNGQSWASKPPRHALADAETLHEAARVLDMVAEGGADAR